ERIIKKIAIGGGVPVVLYRGSPATGLGWEGNDIVFSDFEGTAGQIKRISSNGGKAEILATLKDREAAVDPQILPGGQALLFTISKDGGKEQIVVQSLKSGERKNLIDGGAARYIPTGHILYALGGIVFAVQFDLRRLEIVGGPVPVVEGVTRGLDGSAQYSTSNNGSIAYIPGPASSVGTRQTIAMIERSGEVKPLGLPARSYEYPRISPDGKRIAFGTDDGKERIIWIYDLSGASAMRQLTLAGSNRFPVWSADGQRVLFQSDREGDLGIFWQRADGTGSAERLTKPEKGVAHIPDSASPDGRNFSFTAGHGGERAV